MQEHGIRILVSNKSADIKSEDIKSADIKSADIKSADIKLAAAVDFAGTRFQNFSQ